MEARWQRLLDLLDGHIPIKDIISIVQCSRNFVHIIKRKNTAGKSLARKPGSSRHNTKVDGDFLMGLMAKIEADLMRSMWKLAKDLNVSKGTIHKAMGMLRLHLCERRRRQLLTMASKKKRVGRGKKIISWLKKKPSSTILVFSDKKNWTVDQSHNARNNHYLACTVNEVPPVNQTITWPPQ